ncbi:MAG: HAD-IC family P-type ATPase [Eubacteriales bacterium]|nr:HAD-IC family P-type ATPase [Eubacteriales bacterium]
MTDINKGLTEIQVQERIQSGLENVSVGKQSKTVGQIVFGNVFTYFNFVFAIFAGLLILVRSYFDMTFLPIIVINTLIGIIQEIRSKRVLDKLIVVNASKTKVIRNGNEKLVFSEKLVKDDLCIFEAGNQICADARVVFGSVRVNEALITGEADEITKSAGDKLFSGSFVVSGRCRAVLEKVGHEAYAAKLTMEAKASRKKEQTQMMQSLDRLVKCIGAAIIPIGIILFVQSRFFLGNTLKSSVVSVTASLVGMIPEGLYLLASVALVVSVMRLGKKNVLVHEMACVETLARVNVLCVDKTGTITENEMSVEKVVPLPEYENHEEIYEPLHKLIGDVVHNLNADNITMAALKNYFNNGEEKDYPAAIKISPFSSEVKYSGVKLAEGSFIIGAPEKVLLGDYDRYKDYISYYTENGARILIFGSYEGEIDGRPLTMPVIPYAMIVISNQIRPEAKETFAYFREQGVEIKVISGDNPATASSVAIKAGIENAQNYIDASTLTSDAKLSEAALRYTVFGRVAPEQKRKLVQALKDNGKVVAMTGDGVNDVLALKCADCSVAMASGSDAASNAAQVVLLDSDFSCMPSVVLEGRRVVNNIQRSASLFLVKNIFSMLMTFFTIFAANLYPLYPTQLSLLGAFTIGTPAFFLALQPNRNLIEGNFIRNVAVKAMPAALTDFIVVAVMLVYGGIVGIEHEQLSTISILILLTVGIAALIRICRPLDALRLSVCCCMVAGIIFCIIFLPKVFAIYPLSMEQLIVAAVSMSAAIPLFYGMCKVVYFMFEKKDRHRNNKLSCGE